MFKVAVKLPPEEGRQALTSKTYKPRHCVIPTVQYA